MADAAGTVAARRSTWSDEVGRPCQLLALGLAFVFVYAAASTLVEPAAYRSYLPAFGAGGPPWATDVVLRLFAVYELALALGVLSRRYRYRASLLSAVTLSGIVVVNVGAFDVLFRNVAIALGALALAGLTREEAGAPMRADLESPSNSCPHDHEPRDDES